LTKTKRKKAPKNNKKSKKVKNEGIILLSIFLVFVIVIASVVYFYQNIENNGEVVAIVNGEYITSEELDFWYKLSVMPDFREIVTKEDFLVASLIPQEVLVQEANKKGITSSKEEVEKLLGVLIIESGLTLEEFENSLKEQDAGIEDIKKSFETRVMILNLFEEENLLANGVQEFFFEDENRAIQEYIDGLMENATIEIILGNEKLTSFEETGDKVCGEDKPIVRLYTTSNCESCRETSKNFQELALEYLVKESVYVRHWSLDTGNNLLTLKEETGVPQEEVEIFKKYSPDNKVPLVVVDCKHKLIGNLGVEETKELSKLINNLIGE